MPLTFPAMPGAASDQKPVISIGSAVTGRSDTAESGDFVYESAVRASRIRRTSSRVLTDPP